MGSRFAALLLGLGLVALLEGGLRLVTALDPPAFATELARVDGRALHSVNPAYARHFFYGVAGDIPLRGIRMTPRPYLEPAPAGGLRVLFAGGSTVQGYPHPKRLAAPSYLQVMLGDLWPERQIEVFNAGITAVSSFAVARAVEDGVEALSADLVVVYTGHNEFYGVYGAASLVEGGQALWVKSGHYTLMQWRLTGLVGRLLAALRPGADGPPLALLEVMSRAGGVPIDDPRRAQAAANLEANLRGIVSFCRERAIPLVLCTLTSNERGFAPAPAEPPLVGDERERWRLLLAEGGRGHEPRQALAALDRAEALFAADAHLHFLRGHHLEQLGRGVAAREAYVQARELDIRPWRATRALNQAVRRVAAEEGVLLAEVEARFIAESPAAGVGWELMADHLHPSAAGQALLARVVVEALAAGSAPWGFAPEQYARLGTGEQYRRRLGDLPVEELAVLRSMAALFGEPPMDQGNEARAQRLRAAADSLWGELSPGERRGVERWLGGQGPDLLVLNAANALFASRDFARARVHYRAARLEEPYTVWGDLWSTLRHARCAELTGGDLDAAGRAEIAALTDRMRFLTPAPGFSPELEAFFTGYAHHLLGRGDSALTQFEIAAQDRGIRRDFSADLLELLVGGLVAAGRFADAERYAGQISAEMGREEFGRALIARIRAQAEGP